MYKFLRNLVKSNSWIYYIYRAIGGCVLRIFGLFVKMDEQLLLFVVYGGQRYDDSPKEIYEYMKKNVGFENYKYIWAFQRPELINEVSDTEKVKIDSFHYYYYALKAKYWITNSSASRGINFMKKNTINIFFTHGMTGIKKIGAALHKDNRSFHGFQENFDYIIIEGKFEEPLLKRAWKLTDEKLLNIGLPRNDELLKRTEHDIVALKEKIGIPQSKKVILYAPTFREYKRDSELAVYLKPPFDFELWYRELGDEYVFLLTAHYEVAKLLDIPKDMDFIINAFQYPHINDLMLVSDMLISDYSSIIFDYSILKRPIISYAYDYEEYCRERGVYEGYEDIFSHGVMKQQEEVINFIKNMDYEEECRYSEKHIRDRYLSNYGNATEAAVNIIFGDGCYETC